MQGLFPPTVVPAIPLADAAPVIDSLAVLVLCIVGMLGTVLLLPSHYHPNWRKIGGAVLGAAGLIFAALVLRHEALVHQTSIHTVYFWVFAAISLFGAIRVVTHRRPVYSALYFVLTVFATSGLFVLLNADFMAAALVIIYAGAILITYVFVIMLAVQSSTGESGTASQQMVDYDNRSRDPFIASAIGFALMGVLLLVIFDRPEERDFAQAPEAAGAIHDVRGAPNISGNTQELGVYLFGHQQISLELAGLLLTVAMVGAIIIARRRVISTTAAPVSVPDMVVFPATPVDDNPHSIPVYGTDNPNQKAYPET
jgi:NADH-quinone oxidoreductase subunit J